MILTSDRPKTFSAEYSASAAENEKKYCLVTFSRESKLLVYIVNVLCMYVTVAHKSCPSTATCNCHPRKPIFSLYKFTFCPCLLPCAEYSLSAEYFAAFSCRIFVFGRNKKIRFRSITYLNTCLSFCFSIQITAFPRSNTIILDPENRKRYPDVVWKEHVSCKIWKNAGVKTFVRGVTGKMGLDGTVHHSNLG
jgi:hypothetical protein